MYKVHVLKWDSGDIAYEAHFQYVSDVLLEDYPVYMLGNMQKEILKSLTNTEMQTYSSITPGYKRVWFQSPKNIYSQFQMCNEDEEWNFAQYFAGNKYTEQVLCYEQDDCPVFNMRPNSELTCSSWELCFKNRSEETTKEPRLRQIKNKLSREVYDSPTMWTETCNNKQHTMQMQGSSLVVCGTVSIEDVHSHYIEIIPDLVESIVLYSPECKEVYIHTDRIKPGHENHSLLEMIKNRVIATSVLLQTSRIAEGTVSLTSHACTQIDRVALFFSTSTIFSFSTTFDLNAGQSSGDKKKLLKCGGKCGGGGECGGYVEINVEVEVDVEGDVEVEVNVARIEGWEGGARVGCTGFDERATASTVLLFVRRYLMGRGFLGRMGVGETITLRTVFKRRRSRLCWERGADDGEVHRCQLTFKKGQYLGLEAFCNSFHGKDLMVLHSGTAQVHGQREGSNLVACHGAAQAFPTTRVRTSLAAADTRNAFQVLSSVRAFSCLTRIQTSLLFFLKMEQRRNTRAVETGDPRGNPLTSGIDRYDSHLRKSGGPSRRISSPVHLGGRANNPMITKSGDKVWHCSSESIIYIQNSITPLDCQRIIEYVMLSEECEASRAEWKRGGGGGGLHKFEFVSLRLDDKKKIRLSVEQSSDNLTCDERYLRPCCHLLADTLKTRRMSADGTPPSLYVLLAQCDDDKCLVRRVSTCNMIGALGLPGGTSNGQCEVCQRVPVVLKPNSVQDSRLSKSWDEPIVDLIKASERVNVDVAAADLSSPRLGLSQRGGSTDQGPCLPKRSFQDTIDGQPVYTAVTFATGSQFIRHALDNSEPIAHLQGNDSDGISVSVFHVKGLVMRHIYKPLIESSPPLPPPEIPRMIVPDLTVLRFARSLKSSKIFCKNATKLSGIDSIDMMSVGTLEAKECTACKQVDIKQGFQKCSVYRGQPAARFTVPLSSNYVAVCVPASHHADITTEFSRVGNVVDVAGGRSSRTLPLLPHLQSFVTALLPTVTVDLSVMYFIFLRSALSLTALPRFGLPLGGEEESRPLTAKRPGLMRPLARPKPGTSAHPCPLYLRGSEILALRNQACGLAGVLSIPLVHLQGTAGAGCSSPPGLSSRVGISPDLLHHAEENLMVGPTDRPVLPLNFHDTYGLFKADFFPEWSGKRKSLPHKVVEKTSPDIALHPMKGQMATIPAAGHKKAVWAPPRCRGSSNITIVDREQECVTVIQSVAHGTARLQHTSPSHTLPASRSELSLTGSLFRAQLRHVNANVFEALIKSSSTELRVQVKFNIAVDSGVCGVARINIAFQCNILLEADLLETSTLLNDDDGLFEEEVTPNQLLELAPSGFVHEPREFGFDKLWEHFPGMESDSFKGSFQSLSKGEDVPELPTKRKKERKFTLSTLLHQNSPYIYPVPNTSRLSQVQSYKGENLEQHSPARDVRRANVAAAVAHWAAPGFSHVGFALDETAGWRVFARGSPVSITLAYRPPLHANPRCPLVGSQDLDTRRDLGTLSSRDTRRSLARLHSPVRRLPPQEELHFPVPPGHTEESYQRATYLLFPTATGLVG
ncbi:hypothetical protein PR048_026152 [Dryococelus australis]|uniref:CST complex subunit CTC1 n=1 Tax=Dryococelus australis TaxID=614101 RepID=A0ABQ9GKJ6_9NEOP|nr:hypothetical protein PR048_026152 [Dryococelus australis]